jgi:Ca2+-binding RTX toxin-like protein
MGRVGVRLGRGHRAGAVLGAALTVSLCLSLGLASAATAAVQPGEIFVADPEAEAGKGAILRVDRATGAQTVVSSGGQFQNPVGVAIGGAGELFVADADALGGTGAVFRVDPDTRQQQVVASGGAFREPTGVAAARGALVVADPDATFPNQSDGDGAVISVDIDTGRQSPGTAPLGGQLVDPSGVVLPGGGGLVFTDANAGEGGSGVVYALTLVTRGSFVTLPIASGGNLVDPFGIAGVPSGFAREGVVVADPNAAGGTGAVIGLSPQRVWSSGGDFSDPTGVAFRAGPPSEVLAVDQSAGGSGAVFSVDPDSAAQASGGQNPVSSGGRFAQPTGIAVAPPLCKGQFANGVGSEGDDLIGANGIVAALGGDDVVRGDDSDDLVCGEEGNDLIESEVGVALTYGDDEYLGGDGDDKLEGGFADAGDGRDKLAGGDGDDKARGNGSRDRVTGGDGNDRLSGGNGKDRVGGGKGKDLLRGGKGKDVLRGGKGRDRCVGGQGNDRAAGCERKRKI